MLSIKKIHNHTNLSLIEKMYEQAKILLSFHQSGQWQQHEPSLQTIKEDIRLGQCFGLFQEDRLVGTCALLRYDASYEVLTLGNWLNDEPYLVIHRFVIDASLHRLGLGSQFLQAIEAFALQQGIYNIRVDTHRLNIPMTKLLEKNHYVECGEAFIKGAGPRVVYHKVMRKNNGTTINE
jgi:RimJ/RimL family protein N-acetyltransferase